MTAVRGTFADFKTVKTRGVCQLIIEVPIESVDHALAVLGGVPQAKAEQWVGIAPVMAPTVNTEASTVDSSPEPARLKGGARAKRAGILCGSMDFQNWLYDSSPAEWQMADQTCSGDEADATAQAVRNLCHVKSRAELDHNEEAGRIWDGIEADYRASQRGETLAAREHQLHEGPG